MEVLACNNYGRSGSIVFPMNMWKIKLQEHWWLAQCHPPNRWWGWDLNPGLASASVVVLLPLAICWLLRFRPGWNPEQLIAVYRLCLYPSCLLHVEFRFLKAQKEKLGIHKCNQSCVVWTDGASQRAGKGFIKCGVTEYWSSDLDVKMVQVLGQ